MNHGITRYCNGFLLYPAYRPSHHRDERKWSPRRHGCTTWRSNLLIVPSQALSTSATAIK
jgi:hypothetical protein